MCVSPEFSDYQYLESYYGWVPCHCIWKMSKLLKWNSWINIASSWIHEDFDSIEKVSIQISVYDVSFSSYSSILRHSGFSSKSDLAYTSSKQTTLLKMRITLEIIYLKVMKKMIISVNMKGSLHWIFITYTWIQNLFITSSTTLNSSVRNDDIPSY